MKSNSDAYLHVHHFIGKHLPHPVAINKMATYYIAKYYADTIYAITKHNLSYTLSQKSASKSALQIRWNFSQVVLIHTMAAIWKNL